MADQTEMEEWCSAANTVDERPVLCELGADVLKCVGFFDSWDEVRNRELSLCCRSCIEKNPDKNCPWTTRGLGESSNHLAGAANGGPGGILTLDNARVRMKRAQAVSSFFFAMIFSMSFLAPIFSKISKARLRRL